MKRAHFTGCNPELVIYLRQKILIIEGGESAGPYISEKPRASSRQSQRKKG